MPNRDWEAFDGKNFNQTYQDQGCKDIAAQLIEDNSFIDVSFDLLCYKFIKSNVFFQIWDDLRANYI